MGVSYLPRARLRGSLFFAPHSSRRPPLVGSKHRNEQQALEIIIVKPTPSEQYTLVQMDKYL
jgi:hypothetical protein